MHNFGRFIVGFSYPDKHTEVDEEGKKSTSILSTHCIIKDSVDNTIVGEATVRRSRKDQDVRKIGRKIALSKAMDQGMMTKADRTEIFTAYDSIGALRKKPVTKPKEE
jgi:hypothetical protein